LKAVILAAGEGTRMRPLTYTRPKVMLPIANKPILEHLLLEASRAGIKDFILIVGYRDEQVRGYFGDGAKWQVNIEYCNQRKQAGTADALRMVEGLIDDRFLMINGDILVRSGDITRLMEKAEDTVSVIEQEDVSNLGVVETRQNRVVRIHEKMAEPPSHLANAGLYLFTPEIFTAIEETKPSPRGEYEITDSLQILIDKKNEVSFLELGYWLDVSYPWDLLEANESMMAGLVRYIDGELEPNAVLKNNVAVGKNTVVRSGSYIIGPVLIGDNCDIGPNCYIRPSTSIGDNCHIGASVEVKNSIIMKGTKIPHHNYVGDSIIGENCNLGSGTKIANLKLDDKNITVAGIDTHRRKLGAIIGDEVHTGINSSINTGTVIGNNSFLGPGALAHGVIAPRSKIF
jgi:UDP-N-acetylglucosamine diphosphorylase/glucosamine-1-phosphate N-acetyltransferase